MLQINGSRWRALVVMLMIPSAACGGNSAFQRLAEARRLSADLLVQFTKAADAGNRAVMAEADDMSIAFARESEGASAAVDQGAQMLAPLLDGLDYSEESDLLQRFRGCFAEYQRLDRTILDLAVENTNIKARQISFGSAREKADAFRDALEAVVSAATGNDRWHVRALVASAVANVREIQALQAPHIADPDDAAMARMEQQMANSEMKARNALKELAPIVQAASRPKLSSAVDALDRFMEVNRQIIALSRRNTNVRSLALALNEKGKLTASCEASLRSLQEALAKRGFIGTR